ncbi:MAG TPA: hypothetical protein VFF40_10675 [Acidimicrobiia bacterium]|nr:hypothetical protein [Acidimicrobiia bacterium]
MKRRLVATAAAASLLVGSAAGAVIVVPGLAGAASHDTEVTAEAQDGRPDPTEKIREALQGLVDDDTINASQADAVASTLAESAPRGGPGGGHHRGGGLEGVAEAIGIDADALKEALQSGQTIAEVAEANGVDPQVVVDAMVAGISEKLDQAVESGRLTQEEADQRKAEAPERVAARVNGERPEGGPGRGPGPGSDDGPVEPSSTPAT